MNHKPGYIYILRNPIFKYGVSKIGRTSRSSENRASEISVGTGVPVGFEVLYEEDVYDCILAEKLIHEHLKACRINQKREFFELPLKHAVKIVFSICQEINKKYLRVHIAKLVLHVESSPAAISIEKLAVLLKKYNGGKTDIMLIYGKNDKVILTLGKTWNIEVTQDLLSELQSFDGISDLEIYY